MLGTFRDKIVKWGTQLLFLLIMLSFVAWGIGDYIGYRGPGSNQTVATVGSRSISSREFQREMQDQMGRMRQMLGESFNIEQARAMGIDDSVLQSMIQDALFSEGARNLGLVVDDSVVSQEIRADPSFQTPSGGFDRVQFDSALRRAGYNEAAYVALLRGELLRRQYLSPLAFAREAPQTLVGLLYRYRNEKRVAQVIILPHNAITGVPEASDADLVRFHEDNAAKYRTPEQRALTIVRMRPSDIVDEIDVADERIKEFYDEHLAEFGTPERRSIEQILLPDEKTAREVAERIAKGADFAKVAAEFGGGTLGTLAKREVPVPELAETAFTVLPSTVSDPVESPLGWHLVRIDDVVPATQKALPDVSEEIRKHIAMDKAADSLFRLAGQFEDELGGGASTEEAAKRLKLNVLKIDAVDKEGRDPSGNKYIDMTPDILRVAFEVPAGGDSPLGDLRDGGHYLVHVDKITPSAVRPFDEVKDRVRDDWRADQQAQRAEKIALEIAANIKSGKILADIASARGAKLATTQPFTRTGLGLDAPLPGALISSLFKSAPGTPESAASNDAHAVGVVSQVIAADPVADEDGASRLKDEIASALSNDLSVGLAAALRDKLKVSIDRAAVDSAF